MNLDPPLPGSCTPDDHRLHRRLFLKGLAASGLPAVTSFSGLFTNPVFAEAAKKAQKKVLLLWLCGGPSQFETWDPKPGRASSGPFPSIPTSVPGVRFSSLMPRCAGIAHDLNVVRCMRTKQTEHLQAINLLTRGNPDRAGFTRPTLGAAISAALGAVNTKLPNFILLDPNPRGNEFEAYKASDLAGWLGPQHAPVRLGGSFTQLGRAVDALADAKEDRLALRQYFSKKYENERNSRTAAAQNVAFDKMKGLTASADLFDPAKLTEVDRSRYGPGTFGIHTLMARNLIENGAPFVMVANGMPWDNHVLNHEIHQMLVPELDRILHHLLADLKDRGLLDHTLVVAMGEFGRTPWLNTSRGRDHYPNAWSLMMTGCGLKRGTIVGATDADGVDPDGKSYDEQNLFATIFTALGIDPHAEYDLTNMPTFHRVEDRAEPIREVLA
ncbi:protein of unknown function DUF1501 : Uncharacterized protein OS=Chthoniobacter flavus Ellin428 GN=CfE428DRAFT_6210 PE=4 SV=1: DUF1501 [Gemmata massiliana]|uniref:DUF1501 domain-containing protein n=1 Tax=Gemmata massiliana TaxID=1210884 RepID=A0A6P2D4V1_9BACT|nr:DUF1501 domain-containing protein [Gemmata massiliana]VTR94492.1 protein of unknown function DUF1501 : Uncharacterized protein OS=Chthoniobacter flavus Ellin428 GN=CfE428DRAFT_6210 PE=4 SV=1: DUF1501 [Gemmata massiliana]